MEQNAAPFTRRYFQYLSERFHPLSHGILIASFSFSVISFSRICRQAQNPFPFAHYVLAFVIAFLFFYLLRGFDEFKDKEDDALYRKDLPVPRGLIGLGELRITGFVAAALQAGLILVFVPTLLRWYVPVMVYMLLMSKEFFIATWLRKHQFWYVVSHMLIIPFVDFLTSSFDWELQGSKPPAGLAFFFMVSFFNGILLETGRKMRAPGDEKPGVLTYTSMLGTQKATLLWMSMLVCNLLMASAAAYYAGFGSAMFIALLLVFVLCLIPPYLFWRQPDSKPAKYFEHASGLWSICMYLLLGGIPMLINLFSKA